MEIIKELGHGMFGTVYKIKKDNKYYAMKIEHILKEDVEKNLKSPHWREIHFITKMNSICPDQFIKLYDYEFIEDCDHVQKYSVDLKEFAKYHRDKINKLAKSKMCIRKIYELVDGSVRDIINILDEKQRYSMLAQLAGIINILEKNKYIHGDFHIGNIGYIKTDKKHIKILNHIIPTFGYIFKAIDYGSVMHPTYKLSKNNKTYYKNTFGTEFMSVIQTVMMEKEKFFNFAFHNKVKLDYKKNVKQIMNSDLKNVLKEYTDNKDFIFTLAEVLYPEIFQKIILGKHFTNIIPINLFFDPADFIYIITCDLDLNKIIEYYKMKINNL
jgi:hypothetical protein